MTRKIILALAALVMVQATVSTVQAIPAFARKYGLSCKTCHAPFPRLKKYGLDFAANGYALPDKEAPRAVIDTGDTNLSLLRELPLALRFDGFITFDNSNTNRFDLASPAILKILAVSRGHPTVEQIFTQVKKRALVKAVFLTPVVHYAILNLINAADCCHPD